VDLSKLRGFSESPPADRAHAAHRELITYLSTLVAEPDGCAFEARWCAGMGGPAELVVLGRARATTRDEAERLGARAYERVIAFPSHVRGEPVTGSDDIDWAFQPFAANRDGVAEVRRPYVFAAPQRIDAGVQYYVAATPFPPGPLAWPHLLSELASATSPVMISTGLEPITAPADLSARLGEIATRYGTLAQPTAMRSGGLYSGTTTLPPDPFAAWAREVFHDAERRYRGPLFRLRVSVATAAPLDPLLLSRVENLLGGKGIRPATEPERAISAAALGSVAVPSWGVPDQPVPQSVRLLTELADPAQAASAVWLPVADGGPIGWFPTEDPHPDDQPSHGGVHIHGTVHGDVAGQKNEYR
jgi:hypothetical protein